MRGRLVWLAAATAVTASITLAPRWAAPARRAPAAETSPPLSEGGLGPTAVAPLGAGRLAMLGSSGRRLLVVDGASGKLERRIAIPAEGSGLAVWGPTAYVTTDEPAGRLLAIDWRRGEIVRQWRVGHTPTAPVLGNDGRVLFLANRFENRVRSIDLTSGA